jgi:hypothetical protein
MTLQVVTIERMTKTCWLPLLIGTLFAASQYSTAASAGPPGSSVVLAFADFYKRPTGPRGLEPGAKLLALAGSRVELVGYLVRRANADGPLIVAPLPVVLGDEDESLADDLPPSVAYLHPVDGRLEAAIAGCIGIVHVAGRLEIGRAAEADGRSSFVRLLADTARCAP